MSRKGTYSCFDEKWVRENYPKYDSNKALWDAYTKIYGTKYSWNSFRAYLNQLGYKRLWTKEMTEFLRDKYPEWGAKKSQEELLKKFGVLKKTGTIMSRMASNGIYVNPDAKSKHLADCAFECGYTMPIGTIRFHKRSSRKINKIAPVIKTENGWEPYPAFLCGGKKDGYVACPLDNNPANIDPENWIMVPKRIIGIMGKHRLWSDIPEITESGLLWSELLYQYINSRKEIKRSEQEEIS